MSSLITASIVGAPSSTLKPNPAGPTRLLGRPEIRKSFNGGARARAGGSCGGWRWRMDGWDAAERREEAWMLARGRVLT